MKYYLKPDNGVKTVFTVLDSTGRPVYVVKMDVSALRRHFLLVDGNGSTVAKIMCIRISSAFQYTVSANKKYALVTVDVKAQHQPVKIKGVRWRFRGDVLTRTFDITDESGRIMMTHGRCWNMGSICYAVDIHNDVCTDTELCLSIATAVDCTDLGCITAPVPTA